MNRKQLLLCTCALFVISALGWRYYDTNHRTRTDYSTSSNKDMEKTVFYTLPELLVKLEGGGALKTTFIFEVPHDDVAKIEANLPRLLEALNSRLRELRTADLSGTAGIMRLREEVLLRANNTLHPVKVKDVTIKEISVQ